MQFRTVWRSWWKDAKRNFDFTAAAEKRAEDRSKRKEREDKKKARKEKGKRKKRKKDDGAD